MTKGRGLTGKRAVPDTKLHSGVDTQKLRDRVVVERGAGGVVGWGVGWERDKRMTGVQVHGVYDVRS